MVCVRKLESQSWLRDFLFCWEQHYYTFLSLQSLSFFLYFSPPLCFFLFVLSLVPFFFSKTQLIVDCLLSFDFLDLFRAYSKSPAVSAFFVGLQIKKKKPSFYLMFSLFSRTISSYFHWDLSFNPNPHFFPSGSSDFYCNADRMWIHAAHPSLPFWKRRAPRCMQGSVHCSSPCVCGTPSEWCRSAAHTCLPQHRCQFSCQRETVLRTPKMKRPAIIVTIMDELRAKIMLGCLCLMDLTVLHDLTCTLQVAAMTPSTGVSEKGSNILSDRRIKSGFSRYLKHTCTGKCSHS